MGGQLVLLEGRSPLIGLAAHSALERPLSGLDTAVAQQLRGLAEALLACIALEQVLDAVDVLMVEQVSRLHKALLAQGALERGCLRLLLRGGRGPHRLVCAAVAHQCVLLLEAHLAEVTLEGALGAVRALMLPEVGGPPEGLVAGTTAEGPFTAGGAGVLQQLRGLLEVQLADIAAEEVCLARVGVHVADQVGAVLEGLLAHRALVRPLGAVGALVVHQV